MSTAHGVQGRAPSLWPMLALSIFGLKTGLAGSRDHANAADKGSKTVCRLGLNTLTTTQERVRDVQA